MSVNLRLKVDRSSTKCTIIIKVVEAIIINFLNNNLEITNGNMRGDSALVTRVQNQPIKKNNT